MKVELVSKEGIIFAKDAKHVRVPGELGYMGILNNHTPLLSPLKKGKITIDENEFDIEEGFIKVSRNYVIILKER